MHGTHTGSQNVGTWFVLFVVPETMLLKLSSIMKSWDSKLSSLYTTELVAWEYSWNRIPSLPWCSFDGGVAEEGQIANGHASSPIPATTFHLCLHQFFLQRLLRNRVDQRIQEVAPKLPVPPANICSYVACQWKSSSVTSLHGGAVIQIYISRSAAVTVHKNNTCFIITTFIHLFWHKTSN